MALISMAALTAFPLPDVNAGTLSTAVPRLFGGGRGCAQSLSNARPVQSDAPCPYMSTFPWSKVSTFSFLRCVCVFGDREEKGDLGKRKAAGITEFSPRKPSARLFSLHLVWCLENWLILTTNVCLAVITFKL